MVLRCLVFIILVVFLVFDAAGFLLAVKPGQKVCQRQRLQSATPSSLANDGATNTPLLDNRPFEQRALAPRPARRLNHSFKHLYRHGEPANTTDPLQYLFDVGYTNQQVLDMNASFPPLRTLNVVRQLQPIISFLRETIGIVDITTSVSPQVFGVRLEQTFAPRHAFLVYRKLPHGIELMKQADFGNNTLWEDFILSCRTTKRFVALCQAWQQRYCMDENPIPKQITAKQVEAFDALFSRGIMAAARNELVQYNNTWPLDYVDITPSELIGLLIQHGADPRERDVRGVTLLHWAAGTGNLDALIELSNYIAINVTTNRDGATLLHWAAAGVNSREFGIGGHPAVCEYLLAQFDSSKQRREYLNQKTKDGNSAVMWAAWSGTIDIVKLLVRNRASLEGANRNGCTVAHWAASGGNLEVCRYLYETCRVDFTAANNGGNSPLTHAVAFGRASVVDWLSKEVCSNVKDENALQLAHDFVTWADGDSHRRHILDSLYERDLYDDEFK